MIVGFPFHILARLFQQLIVHPKNGLVVIAVATLHQDWRIDGIDALHRSLQIEPLAHLKGSLNFQLRGIMFDGFCFGFRLDITLLTGPSCQVFDRSWLAGDAGA